MTDAEIIARIVGTPGHRTLWCRRCGRPVQKILDVKRQADERFFVAVECHGSRVAVALHETHRTIEDGARLYFYEDDRLAIPPIDRHGRTPTTPPKGTL